MKLRWSPRAVQRAEEIATYFAQDKPGAARRRLEAIFTAAETLPESPRRGRVVPEVGRPEIRELLLGNYRLIYRIETASLSILTIRHGRQILDRGEVGVP